MELVMYAVMRECRNYFIQTIEQSYFTIANEKITAKNEYTINQYVMIDGSFLNDGVYQIKDHVFTLEGSKDETFHGAICGLAVPADFIELVNEITAFIEKEKTGAGYSNIVSESYRGYSYTLATNSHGQVATWKDVFQNRLNHFRKMFAQKVR